MFALPERVLSAGSGTSASWFRGPVGSRPASGQLGGCRELTTWRERSCFSRERGCSSRDPESSSFAVLGQHLWKVLCGLNLFCLCPLATKNKEEGDDQWVGLGKGNPNLVRVQGLEQRQLFPTTLWPWGRILQTDSDI